MALLPQAYMDRFFYMQLCQVELSVANCDDTADKESDNAVYCLYVVLDLIMKVDWHKIHITLREGCRCCHIAIKSKCTR